MGGHVGGVGAGAWLPQAWPSLPSPSPPRMPGAPPPLPWPGPWPLRGAWLSEPQQPRPPPTYATDEPVPVVCRVLPLPSRRKANLPLRDVFVLLSLAPLSSMHPFRSPVATFSALE